MTFPAELRRYRITVVLASLLLAAAGVVALGLVLTASSGTGSPIPFLLFAVVTLPIAAFGLVGVPRWYRRAGRIVSSTAPHPALATLSLDEGSDSTALYAEVRWSQGSAEPLHPVALVIPAWDVRPLLGLQLPVGGYVDPERSRLVALSTPQGMLWCVPPGRIVSHGSSPSRHSGDHPSRPPRPGSGL